MARYPYIICIAQENAIWDRKGDSKYTKENFIISKRIWLSWISKIPKTSCEIYRGIFFNMVVWVSPIIPDVQMYLPKEESLLTCRWYLCCLPTVSPNIWSTDKIFWRNWNPITIRKGESKFLKRFCEKIGRWKISPPTTHRGKKKITRVVPSLAAVAYASNLGERYSLKKLRGHFPDYIP